MINFGIDRRKISQEAHTILHRAVDETRRRQHTDVSVEHVLYALISVEWDTFCELMQFLNANPQTIQSLVERHLDKVPAGPNPTTPLLSAAVVQLMALTLNYVVKHERNIIEPVDIFAVLWDEYPQTCGPFFRSSGVTMSGLSAYTRTWARMRQEKMEQLVKQFDLPAALKQYGVNLNFRARQKRIHPVTGRDQQLQQIFEVLCHKDRPNSVMLLGEPGVGKTALVETIAWMIEFKPESIPLRLQSCQIVCLSLNSMVAGTSLRGMFEDRIQHIIDDVIKNPQYILFIDEAHMLIGAGTALGQTSDAAQVFKSAMSRGDIRMIGATTSDEFKQYFYDDDALTRRFRNVIVPEPDILFTRKILYGLRPRLEVNYGVDIHEDAIEMALELSPRYQRHLYNPDKVIGWLDTASVRAEIDKRLVVTADDIIQSVASASRIPATMVSRNVQEQLNLMPEALHARVKGQTEAITAVYNRLSLNKSPLKDGITRPDGVLLFLGPTGVGKTEMARALAAFLFGSAEQMIRIDMSEYQEGSWSINKLIGSPRGLEGSGHGGILTNQLKDEPYSLILLDEIEKASQSTRNIFLQAFDEGWVTDGRGKRVYFSDAIVIMTSNIGAEHYRALTNPMGFALSDSPAAAKSIQANVQRELERSFSPEFRNRIDQIVFFHPLREEDVFGITLQYLTDLQQMATLHHKVLTIADEVIPALVARGYDPANGARYLKRTIDNAIKIPLSQMWHLNTRFHVSLDAGDIRVESLPDLALS